MLFRSNGNIIAPNDGYDPCTGYYWITGLQTSLDSNGNGCWNEKNYSNGTIINPSVQGYDSCTGKFWLDYMGTIQETTLDQNGTGWWGPGGNNQVYYIEATPTSLDEIGNGFWNGHAYAGGQLNPTGWNGYHWYIDDVETSLDSNGDGCWNGYVYYSGVISEETC